MVGLGSSRACAGWLVTGVLVTAPHPLRYFFVLLVLLLWCAVIEGKAYALVGDRAFGLARDASVIIAGGGGDFGDAAAGLVRMCWRRGSLLPLACAACWTRCSRS